MRDANLQLKAAGAETSSTNHTAVDLKAVRPGMVLNAQAIVTAVSGTSPTLALVIQESADNSTWRTIATFVPALTAAGINETSFRPTQRYIRSSSTIAGTDTPTFTYGVDIVSVRP